MVDAAPFRGLRYDREVTGDPASTSAPAYDELDPHTYTRHRTASPYTVLELLAPTDPAGSHHAARQTLKRWQRTGVLLRDPAAAFYRYEEHELRHGVPAVQRGVLAAVGLPRPGHPAPIITHEGVDEARVADRVTRLEALRADLSPILALAPDPSPALQAALARPPTEGPVAALTDDMGVDHRVWRVTGRDEVAALRDALSGVSLLVADGHHRYAAAVAAQARHEGPGWRRTLMYVVDASKPGPELLGVHRLARDVAPRSVHRLADRFAVEPVPVTSMAAALAGSRGRAYGLLASPALAAHLGAAAALLRPLDDAGLTARLPSDRSALWRRLDTAVLDHAVLPLLGVGRTEYRADLRAAAAEVAAGPASLLFVVRPVALRVVRALAASGEHLPPKSTYFRPKPRVGLVLRTLDET